MPHTLTLPRQEPITEDRIREMITWSPRRHKLALEWRDPLHPPKDEQKDWSLVLPFRETLENAFQSMCDVRTIGMRKSPNSSRCYTFLRDWQDSPDSLDEVRIWIDTIGPFVAIRDCLALCFALDYDKEEGNPNKPQTRIGELRSRAKAYTEMGKRIDYEAADHLVGDCLSFLKVMTCYQSATTVVGMASSKPESPFHLAHYLASRIARKLGIEDDTQHLQTAKPRAGLKDLPLAEKLDALKGTTTVAEGSMKGRTILLVDDLYQSGVSINYAAMLLLEAGAERVYGLACEKTCRNDDNTSWR